MLMILTQLLGMPHSIEKYGSMDVIWEICELNGIAENQIIYP